jgi:molybdopterin/thiamine biosynthesis adenylyltransferase
MMETNYWEAAGLTVRSKTKNGTNEQAMYLKRFSRQTAFSGLGERGQLRLAQSSALVVGMGGLGSWTAEYLVRAGIGRIRIADDDTVEMSNLHRQALYTEQDAIERRLKVDAAADMLQTINSRCSIEMFRERIDPLTITRAADTMDILLDGTDNYPTRFLMNDYAIKYSIPWIFAGVVEAEGQVMSIIPGKTPCLRCIIPSAPCCCGDGQNDCCRVGVIGAVVPLISAIQSVEAIKILSGHPKKINPNMVKYNFWDNYYQTVDLSQAKSGTPCPCCSEKDFIYLEP